MERSVRKSATLLEFLQFRFPVSNVRVQLEGSLGLQDKVGSERRDKQANNFFINKYKVISYLISWTRSDSPSNTSST